MIGQRIPLQKLPNIAVRNCMFTKISAVLFFLTYFLSNILFFTISNSSLLSPSFLLFLLPFPVPYFSNPQPPPISPFFSIFRCGYLNNRWEEGVKEIDNMFSIPLPPICCYSFFHVSHYAPLPFFFSIFLPILNI